ncbi:MAG: hypothetical protein LR015_07660 [Verrucomicrobia bacterium]|nr:hypothetical protein [Verrucomicrobiota bacterium]
MLYHNLTGTAPFPGTPVTPNVPFRVNGRTGQTVTFYYTYSHPAGGERTTFGQPQSFTLAPCGAPTPLNQSRFMADWRRVHFPEQILSDPALESEIWGDHADPDGDGYTNIMEAYLGMNPLLADVPRAEFWQPENQADPLWSVSLPAHLPEGLLRIESSGNMLHWHPIESTADEPSGGSARQTHHFQFVQGSAASYFRFVID